MAAQGRNPPERKPSGYPQHMLTSAPGHVITALHCHGCSLLSLTIYPVSVWPSRGSSLHTLPLATHSAPPDKSGSWFHTHSVQQSQCAHSPQAVLMAQEPSAAWGVAAHLARPPPFAAFCDRHQQSAAARVPKPSRTDAGCRAFSNAQCRVSLPIQSHS